ncbi:sensor histidine kinase [Agathobacter ruminis]|uniref:Sensor histidine kinase n=1 Tax=Agathobacter ruminis TaxID=1712665 RepID=A0A2G3E2C1_9FIRM|nr:histidine kinase [Agathobacter ruminis]MDC7300223.1 histidine kinase [Agathobacter ruminis]PHU37300.1 sensor histidine kinase [Agathobacter ruminis]
MKIPVRIRSLRLQTKFVLCILLAACLPIITIGVVFFGRFYDMLISDTVKSEQVQTASLIPKIKERLGSITESMSEIEASDLYATMFHGEFDGDPVALMESDQADQFAKLAESIIQETAVTDIKIYCSLDEDSPIYETDFGRRFLVPEDRIKTTYWHGIFSATPSASLHCPKFYLGNYEIENYDDCAYMIRRSWLVNRKFETCYLAVYYPSEIYSGLLSESITVDDSVSYIINEREAVIATTNEALSGLYHLDYYDIQALLMASNSFVRQDVSGGSVYAAFYYIEETRWFVVTVLPERPLLHMANRTFIQFVIICIVSLVLSILVAIVIAHSMTRRISKLSKQMSSVEEGAPVPMKEPRTRDEVGKLISSYNYMTREINDLMQQQKKTAEELRLAEFQSLQAQINPHFLYNTMDMIHWMSLQGRNEEVSEVVQNLSRFYKLTLSRKRDLSSIENELEHAQVYLQLMNMRYDDKIDLVVDVPNELLQYRIPKLTFQPILENSILHGILEKEEKSGTIVLTAWEEEGDIVILISDDGVGMTEDEIARILSENVSHERKGSSIAIYNIHNRLRLLYGEPYGLTYQSNGGCDVTIRIPKIKKSSS